MGVGDDGRGLAFVFAVMCIHVLRFLLGGVASSAEAERRSSCCVVMLSETSTGWKSKSSGLVLGLAVLVYISSIHGDFVFDDIEAIMSNPDVR